MTTLTFRASETVSRRIRAAAKRRGVPVSRFIKEATEREVILESTAVQRVLNKTTIAALREPRNTLARYRTVAQTLDGLKSDSAAKRKTSRKRPSFGEWARRVAGMVKSARRDLSTREGFGD